MMMITTNAIGLLFIIFLIWWFWLSHPATVKMNMNPIVDILVKDGTYQPAHIEARTGQPLTLRFTREDPSPCAEVVVFATLNLNQQLPLNQPVNIHLTLETPGRYPFTCQMGMYRGELIAIR